MYYIQLNDSKYPVTLSYIKQSYPDITFPNSPTDEQLDPMGYANVVPTDRPPIDTDVQYVTEVTPVYDGSQWNQIWQVWNYTLEELASNLEIAQETGQNNLDATCKQYLYLYWSAEAQSNVAMGLYDQQFCELCKTEISDVLSQNKSFVDHVATLALPSEVYEYVQSITRLPITGGH